MGYTDQVQDLWNGGMNILHGYRSGSLRECHHSFVADRQAAPVEMTTQDKGKVLDVTMSQYDDTHQVKPYNDQMDESKAHLRAVSANHLRKYCAQASHVIILGDQGLCSDQLNKEAKSCVAF